MSGGYCMFSLAKICEKAKLSAWFFFSVSWVACFAFNLTKFYVLSVWVVLLGGVLIFLCVSHSIVSNSLWPHGLYSPLGASVHGILQGRILEWVAMPFSRGSSRPRDWTQLSRIAGRLFTYWATKEVIFVYVHFKKLHLFTSYGNLLPELYF